ncbi:MAG TPA: hypothetical protein VGC55_08065 [Dokdonella sp.]
MNVFRFPLLAAAAALSAAIASAVHAAATPVAPSLPARTAVATAPGIRTLAVHGSAAAHTAGSTCASGHLCLAVTLSTALPPACGSTSSIDAEVGERVYACYTATNGSSVELDYHTLSDDTDGTLFQLLQQPLPPGADYQYFRQFTVGDDESIVSTWSAQAALPDYAPSVTDGSGFIDITEDGTALGIGSEGIAGVTLPFDFNFYGVSSNQMCVSSDGFVLLDYAPCPGYAFYASQSLPSSYLPAAAILPLWEELVADTGDIYYATIGSAPNRRFVVEWYDRLPYGASDGFTFELILDESGGALAFQYQDVDTVPATSSGGALAAIGLQANADLAHQFSVFQPSVSSGSGIAWALTAPVVYTASASIDIRAQSPAMTVTPTTATANSVVGVSMSMPMTIGNQGTQALTWSAVQAGATQAGAVAAPRLALGSPSLSAFAEDIQNQRFVTLDASAPGSLDLVASTDYSLAGGDFVDADPTRLYAIDGSSAGHRNAFVSVDTASGAVSDIGLAVPPGNASWSGLAWDPVSRTFYATTTECGLASSILFTIHRSTGTARRVGAVDTGRQNCVVDIAFDSDGRLYGIDTYDTGMGGGLLSIDTATGVAQRIGSLGVNVGSTRQGMSFDHTTHTLYWTRSADDGSSEMYTIDTSTGVATPIAPIGSTQVHLDAFAILPPDDCADASAASWLSIHPASGTTAVNATSTVTLTFNASGLDAGRYHATVCVSGNDPRLRTQAVPVEFVVAPAVDSIFFDGFESL